ncbi:cell division cycle and apoptosis regulator 1 [Olea europaea subsp. europaea]|uniref:Cell division cycle and apoptosis regulator 1 n=1 Tax=Olea europaea subsp. europaea TaxID=158383 RepID=A0A8S0PQ93_OLEEU|nr:cell division cycle and apoptosis regulator 1 [Olea europaea subsp. europaea]
MYSSRGGSGYGQQQPYSTQSSYANQNLGGAFPGSSVGGSDGSLGSRHALMLGGTGQESDPAGYRAHGHSAAPPSLYGGQYSSIYGSSSGQELSPLGAKGSVPSALEGRVGYGSSMPDSPKFTSSDYVSSSSRGYVQKTDRLYPDVSDYSSIDRRQYIEPHNTYIGRDLPSESAGRYTDSASLGHKHQADIYDRMELLRQEQILKARSLQTAPFEGDSRQADYLAARSTVHHPGQDPVSYVGRTNQEHHNLSMPSGSSYRGQHAPSILGAAPQRKVDDVVYAQSSSNPGYGVSLPPGRDYGTGKGLHGTSLDLDYPSSISARDSHPRMDVRKDDKGAYTREIVRREKEHQRDYIREREKAREREKERLRERDRDRDRDRSRERERERERDRERERERERDRERERERRAKERSGEPKRVPELRRERTSPRTSRELRSSSLAKGSISVQRDSLRHEVSHRRHSPVKEKRREYVCKVCSFSFVQTEMDYLLLDKRYPRLFISPECSKVVVNWPKENLRLSFYTPASFEHDFVEEAVMERGDSPKELANEVSKAGLATVWNAKMILMSGLSQNALAELSSDRNYDRIPHFCNMLRFAVLKKNNSMMAIGGPWDPVDGGDPSTDDSSLIRTALRYAKDVVDLDLKKCQHWNRFLEIHYLRVGKDGLFSHKEVTVIYVPDLSECLPSLDSWKDQWLNHKMAVFERERQHAQKIEIRGDKEEDLKDIEERKLEDVKDAKTEHESWKKKKISSSGQSVEVNKMDKDVYEHKGKGNSASDKEGNEKDKAAENKHGIKPAEEDKDVVVENTSVQAASTAKPGKKKTIKRVVKKKAVNDKGSAENAAKLNDKLSDEGIVEKNITSEIADQQDSLSSNPPPAIKTFTRKKIVKKPVKSVEEEVECSTPDAETQNNPKSIEDKAMVKLDGTADAMVQEDSLKTTVKKKVIKRVLKRKAVSADIKSTKVSVDDLKGEMKVVQPEIDALIKEEQNETVADKRDENSVDKEKISGSEKADNNKQKDSQNVSLKSEGREEPKDEKVRKDPAGKDESAIKAHKEVKEKKKFEEPPRHPGLFLRTKGSKDSKIHSLSLSLDSLLDYTDNDIEESRFELSLFAESLHEMLQYKMGCRLLTFLQELRIKFLRKRNQKKRPREETSKKENGENLSKKLVKVDESNENIESNKTEACDNAQTNDSNNIIKEEVTPAKQLEHAKPQDEPGEEDPEEDPEEDEEIHDASPHHDSRKEMVVEDGKTDTDAKSENVTEEEKKKEHEMTKQASETQTTEDTSNKEKATKVESKTKDTLVAVVDKRLLQAFRFFDRNRVGYIRVEDLRLIIHNLGKFLSHRDVKELVQSALLESNTGRDDRILYDKLVKKSDI